MKKTYVKPESSLMRLNFSENIVASSLGSDIIAAGAIIKFTHSSGVCREYFSGDLTAEVDTPAGSPFKDYYDELYLNESKDAYHACFVMDFDTAG